jgi:hypothetical protein
MTPKEIQTRINEINANYERVLAAINERREYRMKNYYDCIDDYSWGGMCDKADDLLQERCRAERDILIEQAQNDGCYYRTSMFYRLKDDNGNVADGATYGQYGEYFRINGKFVGVPKKVSTLTRKGYTLELVTRKYKCTFKSISKHGNIINKSMECVDENIVEVTQDNMPECIGELNYIDYQYNEYFNN